MGLKCLGQGQRISHMSPSLEQPSPACRIHGILKFLFSKALSGCVPSFFTVIEPQIIAGHTAATNKEYLYQSHTKEMCPCE